MFTNAGMNQFKDIFLELRQPEAVRVANSQKCLRVSGKHNDLEQVGKDTYHHTMFEMLGNWSFGDYFKKEAIEYAWEFLTEIMHIDPKRLYATVFEGDEQDNTHSDEEAKNYWKQYLPENRILYGNKKDNSGKWAKLVHVVHALKSILTYVLTMNAKNYQAKNSLTKIIHLSLKFGI